MKEQYNKNAVKEVLRNIEREKPHRDCNQCPKMYKECKYKNQTMINCDKEFELKMDAWLRRKKIWERRLV